MARSTRRRVAGRTRPESLTTRETVIGETAARRATSAMVTVRDRGDRSVVQDRLYLGVVDVGLVVPVEASVDILGQRLAFDGFYRGIDTLVADADRVLRNGARFHAAAHRVSLLLARVVANDDDLAALVELFDRVQDADDRALIGAEKPLEVWMSLHHGFGDIGRLELIAGTVLDIDDVHLGVFALHLVDETVAPIDARAAGLIVHDHANLTLVADQGGHLVGSGAGRGDVVCRGGRHRDVAVDARVKADDRDLGCLGLFEQRHDGFAVQRGQTDRLRLFVEGGLQHFDLFVDHRFAFGAFKRDLDVQVLGGVLRTEFDGLPELMLEAFGDDRDVGVGRDLPGRRRGRRGGRCGCRRWFGRRGRRSGWRSRRRGGRTGADDHRQSDAGSRGPTLECVHRSGPLSGCATVPAERRG